MKIGIVTPWFNDNISGGAERFAGGIARSLLKAGSDVEILTTCGRDSFWDWGKDYYREEVTQVNDLIVRRFSLNKRNKELYDDLMGKLIQGDTLTYVEEMQLLHETVNSESLYNFIYEQGNNYIFIFIPYLFGTTYWGSKIRPDRSFIIPCFHDEDMAYFKTIKDMVHRVSGLLFNTIEEQTFSTGIHLRSLEDGIVSGGGVQIDLAPNPGAFRLKHNIEGNYFIYVGRQVTGKNVPQLIDLFKQYSKEYPGATKLVFIGKGEEQIIDSMRLCKDIIHVGEVSDQEKYDAVAGAIALIQPSLMESFSIVIMESWLCKTPVLVHKECLVTNAHCTRSEGGMAFNDYSSFKDVLNQCISSPDKIKEMADRGYNYVKQYYTWEKTAERILGFLDKKGFPKEEFVK